MIEKLMNDMNDSESSIKHWFEFACRCLSTSFMLTHMSTMNYIIFR